MSFVFLCVGSNKVVCDSFAPFVGSILIKNNIDAYVYGNLKNPINAINLDYYIALLNKNHKEDFVVVLDTRLVENKKLGLSFEKGNLEVAALSLKRKVGDYHLTLDIPLDNIEKVNLDFVIKYAITAYNKLKEILKNFKVT